MAKNKMADLRDHLFETIEALKDKDAPLDPARAKAICEVGQTIINTAKVEIDLLKVVDGKHASPFFGDVQPVIEEAGVKRPVLNTVRPASARSGTE